MLTQVIVNNFNYARYISNCLESLLSQDLLPDEIIFVDDGSQDGSIEIAKGFQDDFKSLKIICKKNAGQLSTFNVSIEFVKDDALVFLMDSDDTYPPDYISGVVRRIKPETDVFFATTKKFELEAPESALTHEQETFFIPKSQSLARLSRPAWIGNVTSAIVIKGFALKKILPYPDEQDWVTRADDVIVFAASLMGMSKQIDNSIAIGYRQHGSNAFARKKRTAIQKRHYARAKNKLISYYCRKAKIFNSLSLQGIFSEIRYIRCEDMKKFRVPFVVRLVSRLFRHCGSA